MNLAAVLGAYVFLAASPSEASKSITVQAATPSTSNCIPFGRGTDAYTGFVYKNIPAFTLEAGDRIAFDMGSATDVDISKSIAMVATAIAITRLIPFICRAPRKN